MARRDFITSLLLVGLGLFALVESLRMPRMAKFGYDVYAAPGVLPAFLGAVIAFLGGIMLVRSIRAGGWRLTGSALLSPARWAATAPWRLATTLGLILAYSAVLVGLIPFWLATFLFVFAFIGTFEWESNDSAKRRAWKLGLACVQAVIVAIAVTWLFERVFRIHLPG